MQGEVVVQGGDAPLSESVFEMVQCAVDAARNYQIRSVASLRSRLIMDHPGREQDVDGAIKFWSEYVRKSKGTLN